MPAYNEAAGIGVLLDRAAPVLQNEGLTWSIVVVDDGSKDDTAARVRAAAEGQPSIHLVRHEVNRGLGPAIVTGLKKGLELASAKEGLIVTMDADLTHPPEVVPRMRKVIDAGVDLVIASRFQPGSKVVGVSAFRRLLSWGARRTFQQMLALPGVRDYTCGFRGFRSSLIRRGLERYGAEGLIVRRGFACTDELLVKLALLHPMIREVPFVLRYDQKRGKSKIRLGLTIVETLRLVRWARAELKKEPPPKAGPTPPSALE
jgi:dolichol-phosphate mannosyltransferase